MGEWGDVGRRSRGPFLDALRDGDTVAVTTMLAGFLGGPLADGLVTRPLRGVTASDHVIGDLQFWAHLTGGSPTDMATYLQAPSFGHPDVVEVQHAENPEPVPVTYDTARHDYHAQRILRFAAGPVLEIGGGYGGMARQLCRRGFRRRVYDLDIPETLYLAYAFLLHETDRTVAFVDEDSGADIVLVPVGQEHRIPAVDLVYSANALGEMPPAAVHGHMRTIERLAPRWVYHQGAHFSSGGGMRSTAYTEVLPADFGLRGYREVYRARACWGGTGDRYWEFLLERAT